MIKARYQIEPTSPGAMLREELRRGTPLGIEADRLTSQGQLASDATVIQLVENWLATHGDAFVFDGYPRTLGQADSLEALLRRRENPIEVVFYFNVPVEVIRERVLHRLTCEGCGRIFSTGLQLPEGCQVCPVCQGSLVRRKDDTAEALERRMLEYREKTEPLIDFYRQRGVLHELSAAERPETVFAEISTVLEAA